MDKARQKEKEYYDSKHMVGNCFSVGSLVLKKDFLRKKRRSGKQNNKWLGPCMLITSLSKGLFKLRELNGEMVLSFFQHNYFEELHVCICCQEDIPTCTLI